MSHRLSSRQQHLFTVKFGLLDFDDSQTSLRTVSLLIEMLRAHLVVCSSLKDKDVCVCV